MRAIVRPLLDPAVVEECMHCLVGAAAYQGAETDVALTSTALARDLADTQNGQAVALLDAAAHKAGTFLDASDIGTDAFARARRRLTSIQSRVQAMLVDWSACVEPPPPLIDR